MVLLDYCFRRKLDFSFKCLELSFCIYFCFSLRSNAKRMVLKSTCEVPVVHHYEVDHSLKYSKGVLSKTCRIFLIAVLHRNKLLGKGLESLLLEADEGRAIGHLSEGHRYCGSRLGAACRLCDL